MLAIERKNEILDKLRTEQRVLVSDLAEYYHVTEETIRRDLDKLEKEGYATKTYGGAILGNSTKTDLSYTIRNKTNVEAKTQIAALASRLIEDGDHLMLDDSSTSLYLAKKLKEKKNLTVKGVKGTVKKLVIPKKVVYKGIRFDVAAIDDRAFYKNRKIRRALIGTNIKSIGKMAFYGTKQLRYIDIRTKKLKAIGKKAFIGIYPAAKIKIPRTRKKKYIKLLANKYG